MKMGFKKTADLAVKVGSYEKNGKQKARYENIGMVLTNDDGSSMMLIKRTFNPAGVPNPDGKDSIVISKFDVVEDAPKNDEFFTE
jgi:hypothetical protein